MNDDATPRAPRNKLPDRLQTASILFLTLLFTLSSLDKLFHYRGFVNALRNYVILPPGVAPYFALPVITVELAIAIGLLMPTLRKTVAIIGALMMLIFTTALFTNFLYGSKGVCGCWFSFTLAQGNTSHIVSNLMLLGLFLTLAFGYTPGAPSVTGKE
jgi:uncharacterized membrane protein YphA (DoxX/SURF4 family)